jgi:hypothetical protein
LKEESDFICVLIDILSQSVRLSERYYAASRGRKEWKPRGILTVTKKLEERGAYDYYWLQ